MTAINSNRAIRGPVTAVPVVAGKGVRLVADTENNRVVAEADETVLWEGNFSSGNVILSESIYNFERIRYYMANGVNAAVSVGEFKPSEKICLKLIINDDDSNFYMASMLIHPLNNTTLVYDQIRGLKSNVSGTGTQTLTGLYGNSVIGMNVIKVVGINRVSASA